nr:MAG TPA: hypothetical protein [Caudoviricetes sp.]
MSSTLADRTLSFFSVRFRFSALTGVLGSPSRYSMFSPCLVADQTTPTRMIQGWGSGKGATPQLGGVGNRDGVRRSTGQTGTISRDSQSTSRRELNGEIASTGALNDHIIKTRHGLQLATQCGRGDVERQVTDGFRTNRQGPCATGGVVGKVDLLLHLNRGRCRGLRGRGLTTRARGHRSRISRTGVRRRGLNRITTRGRVSRLATRRRLRSSRILISLSHTSIHKTNLTGIHNLLQSIALDQVLVEDELVFIRLEVEIDFLTRRVFGHVEVFHGGDSLHTGSADQEITVLLLLNKRHMAACRSTGVATNLHIAVHEGFRPCDLLQSLVELQGLTRTSQLTGLGGHSDHTEANALDLVLVDGAVQLHLSAVIQHADGIPLGGEHTILADLRIIGKASEHLHVSQGQDVIRITYHFGHLNHLSIRNHRVGGGCIPTPDTGVRACDNPRRRTNRYVEPLGRGRSQESINQGDQLPSRGPVLRLHTDPHDFLCETPARAGHPIRLDDNHSRLTPMPFIGHVRDNHLRIIRVLTQKVPHHLRGVLLRPQTRGETRWTECHSGYLVMSNPAAAAALVRVPCLACIATPFGSAIVTIAKGRPFSPTPLLVKTSTPSGMFFTISSAAASTRGRVFSWIHCSSPVVDS